MAKDFVEVHVPRWILRLLADPDGFFDEALDRANERAKDELFVEARIEAFSRAYRTGRYFASIEKTDFVFQGHIAPGIFTDLYYAKFLEFGTRYMAPRFIFQTAKERALPRIVEIYQEEALAEFEDNFPAFLNI